MSENVSPPYFLSPARAGRVQQRRLQAILIRYDGKSVREERRQLVRIGEVRQRQSNRAHVRRVGAVINLNAQGMSQIQRAVPGKNAKRIALTHVKRASTYRTAKGHHRIL